MKLRYFRTHHWKDGRWGDSGESRYSNPKLQYFDEKDKEWKHIPIHTEEITFLNG